MNIQINTNHIHGISCVVAEIYDEFIEEKPVIKPSESRKIIKYSFGIEVDGDGTTYRNFIKDPYFKLYNGSNFLSAEEITRISISKPKYVIHNNDIWLLSSNQRKNLMKLLKYKYKDDNSVWQLILEECLREADISAEIVTDDFRKDFMKKPIPDYTKLQ